MAESAAPATLTPATAALPETLTHGSAVCVDGCGLLLTGAPGRGKSSLALSLILEHGATLIADDQVHLWRDGAQLWMAPPPRLAGVIEVRELGLLRLPHTTTPCPLTLVVHLKPGATLERLPPAPGQAFEAMLGIQVPLVRLAERSALTPLKALLALRAVTGAVEIVDDLPL